MAKQSTHRAAGLSSGDEYILGLVARWRKARAEALSVWADDDIASRCGFDETAKIVCPTKALLAMSAAAKSLAIEEPHSAIAAREMLSVALTILSHRRLDPDTDWYEGPVFEIIQKVHGTLAWTEAGHLLKPL